MPTGGQIGEMYQRALIAMRGRAVVVTRETISKLEALYERALRDIMIDLSNRRISPERAIDLRRQINEALRVLRSDATQLLVSGAAQIRSDMAVLHTELLRRLERLTGNTNLVQRSLRAIAFDDVARAIALRPESLTRRFATVVNRRLPSIAGMIDDTISSGILRGVSSRRLTAQLTGTLNVPVNPDGSWVPPEEVLRKAKIDAARIARTEMANYYRESNNQLLVSSGLVVAVKWQLSGAHPVADVCDVLALSDLYGFGPGYYDPRQFPAGPHPNCGCYQGGPVLYRSPADWNRPAGELRGISGGAARFFIPDSAEHSAKYIARQIDLALQSVFVAAGTERGQAETRAAARKVLKSIGKAA